MKIPGNFPGFVEGTNFAPIANAIGGPKIKPRASIPKTLKRSFQPIEVSTIAQNNVATSVHEDIITKCNLVAFEMITYRYSEKQLKVNDVS